MDRPAWSLEQFEPRVGESFAVEVGLPEPLRIVLREAARLPVRRPPAGDLPGGRDGFQLLFEGEGPYRLVQLTHRLHHEALGELDIFLVPIAGDGDRFTYQAIFS